MKSIILVTGASSGIGYLTSRALAAAGHTVYASMRDIGGRNAPRVRELRDWSFSGGRDLRRHAAREPRGAAGDARAGIGAAAVGEQHHGARRLPALPRAL